MARFVSVFCFLITTFACAQQQVTPDQLGVQQVIHKVFGSFSDGSLDKMEEAVTPDFIILEQGEIWTMDSIGTYFKRPRPADFKRLNTLEFFQTELSGEMAFVSYHNTADIRANGKNRKVRWLESAVLIKAEGEWKVKMLHSTRVQP